MDVKKVTLGYKIKLYLARIKFAQMVRLGWYKRKLLEAIELIQWHLSGDREELLRYAKALDMALLIWSFEEELRRELDAGENLDTMDRVWDKWRELKDEYEIHMEDLIS